MYQAQVENVDGVWVPLCEPTPYFREAQRVAESFSDSARVACVDTLAAPE